MDERARTLLKTLVEHYIADGQPVGSRALSKFSGLDLSPATIRNVMADLEEAGFVASPHTSAGRVPTARGYRLFVDSLLTVQPLAAQQMGAMEEALAGRPSSQIIASASQLLSSLTHFAGVVIAPRRQSSRIRQIEFLSLSEKRILLIIVTADGDVQNRIISTDKAYSPSELVSAANYLTQNFAGLDFEQMRQRLSAEIRQLRDDIKPLMALALEAGDAAMSESATPYVISGERNLLDVEELSSNMKRLRELLPVRTALQPDAPARRVEPGRRCADIHWRRIGHCPARRMQRHRRPLHRGWPGRRLGRRHRSNPHGLRTRHSHRRHHRPAAVQRPLLQIG